MKKLFLLFALVLTVCSTAMAEDLYLESEVGTIGTLNGREAMVVDLGGTIGKVAVATRNVGAEKASETMFRTAFGTKFNLGKANDPNENGLTDGWYIPSKAELEALKKNLTPYQSLHCVEWKVTDNATLYLPSLYKDTAGGGIYRGRYASSDREQEGDTWKCWTYQFLFYENGTSFGDNDFEESDEQETEDCAIRPFHKLPSMEELYRTIWYTSSDGELVTPYNQNAFGGASIVSNEYDEVTGKGCIKFDRNLTSIGNRAFEECNSLTSITLPSGVTSIGFNAFLHCSSLTSINLPSGLTSIGESAFEVCSSLTSINLPSGVTSIGYSTFYGCSSLTSINLPSGLTSIGKRAFEVCSSLTSINLPSGLTSIGERAFYGCSSLTSINLPSGVTSIGYSAFNGCSSLTSINLPNGVTSIEDYMFSGCSSLTSVNLPSGLTSIGDYMFSGCSSLTSINLPDGLTSIGDYMFSDCSSLTSVNLPSGLTSIGDYMFSGCSSLTSVNLPNTLESIGSQAFGGCSSLTSIMLPSSLQKMTGSFHFTGCSSLVYAKFLGSTPPTYPKYDWQESYPFTNSGANVGGTVLFVPDGAVSSYTAAGYTNVYSSSESVEEFKSKVLEEIETAMNGVTLTQDDAAIVTACLTNISNATDIETILQERATALSVINLQKAKVAAIAAIDAKMTEQTDEVKTDLAESVSSWKEHINSMTDIESLNKELELVKAKIDAIAKIDAEMADLCEDIKTYLAEYFAVWKEQTKSATNMSFFTNIGFSQISEKIKAITAIDKALDDFGSSSLTQENIEDIEVHIRNIATGTDLIINTEKEKAIAIIMTKPREAAKNDMRSHYLGLSENDLKLYFDMIDNAGSLAEIEEIFKKAKSAFQGMPHFVLGEQWYFVTLREPYSPIREAIYYGGIPFPDGVVYQNDFHHTTLTNGFIGYTRTLPEGVWQCWYEPFDIYVDTVKFDAAEVAYISIDAQGEVVVWFKKLENGAEMYANTAYVIRAKEGQGNLKIEYPILYPSTESQLTIQSAYENFTLTGNYSPVEHGDWYTLDGTGKFSKMSSGSLKPQRFYLTITPREDAYYKGIHYEAKPFIDIMVLGDEETTGIESLTPTLSEGKGVIYDLTGRKMTSFQKGQIYIKDGKKFIAK